MSTKKPPQDELRPATELRRRMIADMQRVGMSEERQRMYVRTVRQLAEHYHKPPDKITDEELRQYLLYLKTDTKRSRYSIIIAHCGIKFFYERTLKRKWPHGNAVRPPSALQRRMIEDLQLAGMSERTQQMYVRAVRMLAEYYKKPPDQITEEELRRYFLYIKNEKKWSRTGITIALCGIKFFYEKTLKRKWPIFNVVRPHAEKKLPVILSREEVREILGRVRLLRYRICLQTIYSCGLRLREGTELKVGHVDSRRMVIHLRHGKGNKDRYIPLPQITLERLREYWKTHRNPTWIFPAPGRGGIHRSTATTPMPYCNVQDAFRAALKESGINKKATVHEPCQEYRYSYHSCQDRHCPKCGNGKADEWLKMQSALLLPVTYFMLTITLPDTINAIARSNQAFIYSLFFQTAAAALQKLARDPKFVGGQLGFFGVLQTWARDLAYHPHLHFIVAGGGLSPDAMTWLPVHGKFLVPAKALSKIFRAKFRDALKKKPELFKQVPPETWKKDWVVDCRPVGSGEQALKYLAPYIFRVAISNRRLLKLENGHVTFQYRDGETKQFKTRTVTAEEFIRRFLQHILPHRFIKVRYYGFLSSSHRKRLEKVKELLNLQPVAPEPTDAAGSETPEECEARVMRCPKCGGVMKLVGEITPKRTRSP